RFTRDTKSPDSLRWWPWNSHTDVRRCSLLSGRQSPIHPHRFTHSSFQWHLQVSTANCHGYKLWSVLHFGSPLFICLQILGFAPRCHRRRHRVPGHRGRSLRPRLRRHLRQQPHPARRANQHPDRRLRRTLPRGNRCAAELDDRQQVPLHHQAGEVLLRRRHHLRRVRRGPG
ncbi:hypothetical protein MUK42_11307, partial [Musa troglodytarum]